MKQTRGTMIGVVTTGLIAVAVTSAWAFPMFTKQFNDTYGIKPESNLGKARCAVCHTSHTKGDALNAYGADMARLMQEANTKKMTPEILKALEPMDSDKDGVSNLDEIKADSFPGTAGAPRELQAARVDALANLEAVAPALATAPAATLGNKQAELRLAVAGQDLAVQVKVADAKLAANATTWTPMGVELAAASADGKTIRRVVLQTKGPQAGTVQLFQNATEQPAPPVKWKATAQAGSLEIVALIPLAALQIDPKAASFPFEAAVMTMNAENKCVYTSLFGSPMGYTDSSKFGTVKVAAPAAK